MNIHKSCISILGFLLILLIPAMAISAQDNLKVSTSKNNPKISKEQLAGSAQEGDGMRYISNFDQNSVERQLKSLFVAKGFTHRRDKDIRSGKKRRICFEKDNLTIDVLMVALGNRGTEVTMFKYDNAESAFDIKETVAALKNPSVELPSYKKDNNNKVVSYKPSQDKELESSDIGMDIPVPPNSELLKEKVPDPLIGVGGFGQVYQSDTNNPNEVEKFYRTVFKKMGFKENQERDFKVMNFKGLRFESNNMAIQLYLFARGEKGSRFIVVKYMDKEGVSKIEANPLYMAKLPQKDNMDVSDFADVPRPPNSVRRSGGTGNNGSRVSYVTPMSVREVRDFYKLEMPSLGWQLSYEADTRANDEEYAKKHKGAGFVRSIPIGTKMDLGNIVRNSFVLEFKSNAVTVQIMIYPNFVNTSVGSMVDISYIYSINQERR